MNLQRQQNDYLLGLMSPLPLHTLPSPLMQTNNLPSKVENLEQSLYSTSVALRQVFCYTGDTAHEEMQKACFDYLRLGGWYSEGPISLLSGLRPSPSTLVMHFFAVAIFGVGRLLLPRPTFK